MKKIAILGSTGSIGTQTLEIVRDNSDLQVVALAAGSNVELMEKQVREFKPRLVSLQSEAACKDLADRLKDMQVTIVPGMDGLIQIAEMEESDILVTAIVGMIGIRPTIAAIKKGKDIALANKETLVTAGHIIMPLAAQMGVSILPVDSEHSAIFQSMQGEKKEQVSKLLITASGGPFRGRTREQLADIRVEDALKHPNWSMGHKITIDSATLVNKGLEVMEAKWLFDVDLDNIEVLVHPQSIIHSMVEFKDGSVIAQIAPPDMKLPISYALGFPERLPSQSGNFDFSKPITFEKPNETVFPLPKYARQAMMAGGTAPAALNAANEAAVKLFLDGKIAFTDILRLVEHILNSEKTSSYSDYREIISLHSRVCDRIIRDYAHILRY